MPQGARSFRIDNLIHYACSRILKTQSLFQTMHVKSMFYCFHGSNVRILLNVFLIWIAKEETGFYWTKSDSKAESDLKIFIRNEMVLFKSWVVGDESMINSWSLFSWVLDTFVSLHFKFLNRVLWREWI